MLNFSIKQIQESYVTSNSEHAIIFSKDKAIEVWNLFSKTKVHHIEKNKNTEKIVNAVCVGKDPTKIYYQSNQGEISLYSLKHMKISKIF